MTTEEKLKLTIEALKFYADPNSWDYTDSGMQFSWNSTIKNDVYLNPEVDDGGGTDYAGKRAKETLEAIGESGEKAKN